MKILVHSSYNARSIAGSLGKAEYSYYFVMAGFLPALRQLGTVVEIKDPEREADAIFDACQRTNEACVLLCFAPPYQVPITLRCPTIPIIAWEFTTIPCEAWGDDPRSDWRAVFAHCGRVITLSRHTARLVQDAMGPKFPVFAIPTASYDSFANPGAANPPVLAGRDIGFRGFLFDSAAAAAELAAPPEPSVAPVIEARRGMQVRVSRTVHYLRAWYREVLRDVLPGPLVRLFSFGGRRLYQANRLARRWAARTRRAPKQIWPEHSVTLNGVVYASVLSPQDGRKNWHDLLTGFLWTFRENPNATLILKLPLTGGLKTYPAMRALLARFAPFQCRVVLVAGFLEDAEYKNLIQAATYYVNTSHCEGLCLPLMEFLSAGKPAIAPDHTAMADYITPSNAFVLRGSLEHNVWPHDPRDLFTTMRYRLNWQSLASAFEASYLSAIANDKRYTKMSTAAQTTMRDFCSVNVVRGALADALGQEVPSPAPMPLKADMVTA